MSGNAPVRGPRGLAVLDVAQERRALALPLELECGEEERVVAQIAIREA